MVGIPIGILIGVLSGVGFLVLVWTALKNISNAVKIPALIAELFAIPSFWFGGKWGATALMSEVQFEAILEFYLVSLSVTFVVIAALPLYKLVRAVANALDNPGGPND